MKKIILRNLGMPKFPIHSPFCMVPRYRAAIIEEGEGESVPEEGEIAVVELVGSSPWNIPEGYRIIKILPGTYSGIYDPKLKKFKEMLL